MIYMLLGYVKSTKSINVEIACCSLKKGRKNEVSLKVKFYYIKRQGSIIATIYLNITCKYMLSMFSILRRLVPDIQSILCLSPVVHLTEQLHTLMSRIIAQAHISAQGIK